jgi:predicted dienelactone hydrolase
VLLPSHPFIPENSNADYCFTLLCSSWLNMQNSHTHEAAHEPAFPSSTEPLALHEARQKIACSVKKCKPSIINVCKSLFWGGAIATLLTPAPAATAAERLTMRLGPLEQTVSIAELQHFAATGETPDSLWLYSPLLNSQVQTALSSQIQIEPQVGQKIIDDLLYTSSGKRFLNTLQSAIPESEPEQVKTAVRHVAKHPEDLSILGLLQAIPGETVAVDLPSVLALASQFNLPAWQSQMLSSVLDKELTIKPDKKLPVEWNPAADGDYHPDKIQMLVRDYQRDRLIPFDIYWADRTEPGPMVVMSHGFGADRRFLRYLAQHLASHGITVVAIEHPGSNVSWLVNDNPLAEGETPLEQMGAEATSLLPAAEFVDRPKDVSVVLDRLQQLNQVSTTFKGKLNTEQVTMIGHSLGGYTALTLAGAPLSLNHLREFCKDPNPVALSPADLLQCNAADLKTQPDNLRDRRIAQTIILNPIIGRLFDANSLAQVQIPTLMLASTNDAITPAVSQQFIPFTQLQAPQKYLLTAIGATHLSVGDPDNLNRAITQSFFVQERSKVETESMRVLLQGISLSFVKQLTPERDRYRPYLSAAYAQSFSNAQVKLRFNAELPSNLTNWLKVTALPMEQLVASTLSTPKSQAKFGICRDRLSCLLSSLPLAMFILPGGLPFARREIRKWRRRRWRKH